MREHFSRGTRFRSGLVCTSALTGILMGLLPVLSAHADGVSQDDLNKLLKAVQEQKAKIAAQQELLQTQAGQLRQQQQLLQQLQQQLSGIQTQVGQTTPASAPLPAKTLSTLRGTGPAPAQAQTAAATEPVGAPPSQPEHPPEINVLADRGGVLTPRHVLQIEPSIEYDHTTQNSVGISGYTVLPAITVGTINVSKANHDVLTVANTFRYGVTNRLELETRIPFVYAHDETTARPLNTGSSSDTITSASGANLGDIEVAAHYQLNNGQGGWPYFVGNLRFKTTTGTDPFSLPVNSDGVPTKSATGSGFYNLEPSLTAIYPTDPAVFFGNVGYLIGFDRDVTSSLITLPDGSHTAKVSPGNAIRFSFGLGFGINEASSFSLGYDYSIFDKTQFNGVSQAGSDQQIGSVLIGYSYRFNDRVSFNLSTAIGVTNDAPNTQIIARIPIRFGPF